MAGIEEACSVCASEFEVQFRYQMEERDGGFSFYCSQKCLEHSQRGAGKGDDGAICDACAKRFQPDLVSQVLYVGGRRRYACSLGCRAQLVREAGGARLGELVAPIAPPPEAAVSTQESIPAVLEPRLATTPPPAATAPPSAAKSPAVAVPVMPQVPKRAQPAAAAMPTALPRTLAIFNHKGGTGKTTTAVSVAAGLASRGKRVLLVDTDAQGNVSVSLGANAERSLYHVLVMGLRVSDAVKTVRPNLDLLPSNETLAAAELYLAGRQNRDRVLSERLAAASAGYDFVDPRLLAEPLADEPERARLRGQRAHPRRVRLPLAGRRAPGHQDREERQRAPPPPGADLGRAADLLRLARQDRREAVSTLKGHFGDRCLPPIRAAIKVKEAPAQGQTIFEYASGTNAADDYLVVVDRILASRYGAVGADAGGARAGDAMAASA